ncbi:MAG: HEPN domain protein [Microgenomates group bacterium Gr01-1014_16]|nr:MAG: HEPN domain protein [Microgenomates group bacterium Gr01-1014_16]
MKKAKVVWKSGKDLHNALFFAQLSLEKILKALHYYKKDDHPLMTHDLTLLAKKVGLETENETGKDLKKISTFNINARYDDYKRSFRKGATKEFVDIWMNKSSSLRDYLLSLFGGKNE